MGRIDEEIAKEIGFCCHAMHRVMLHDSSGQHAIVRLEEYQAVSNIGEILSSDYFQALRTST
jgi:hypothetical protein